VRILAPTSKGNKTVKATKIKNPNGSGHIFKVYEVAHNGLVFEVDGQNGFDNGSNEWQLILNNNTVDIFPTKRAAMAAIVKFF